MPVIPLNDTLPWTQIISSANQAVFSTNWTADDLTDVVVYSRLANTTANDATQIVSTMNYNVAFVGSNQYVQVTFIAGHERTLGAVVTIMRNTPADRLNLYTNTNFNPTMLNGDFNRDVMMIQQRLLCDDALSVKYNNSETLNPNGITDNILPYLPPNNVWVKNDLNTEIIALPYSQGGGGGSGSALTVQIVQTAHGFTQDQVVYNNAGTYELALADDPIDAEVLGMVISVTDANTFIMCISGKVETAMTLTPGSVYWLSDVTAGLLTTSEPTTAGHVSKPLLIATESNTGFFYNMRGKVINVPQFFWRSLAVDTTMGVNTGYYLTGGGNLQLQLPAVCEAGSVFQVAGFGSTGWTITQQTGQQINFGNKQTTLTTGTLASTNANDQIELICTVANTNFAVLTSVGNITYT